MTKKQFIALAETIRNHNEQADSQPFTKQHQMVLAEFCRSQNPRFLQNRWFDFISGVCGPNGGKR